jgi:anti-sigma B factor antagonist
LEVTLMDFQITVERLDTAWVVSLSGEVDLYAAPEFKEQLLEVIEAGATLVVVDLSSTTFIDSTTLGVLMGGLKRLRQAGGDLSLVCSEQSIIRVFEITGLDRAFSIYPSRVEAVGQLQVSGSSG